MNPPRVANRIDAAIAAAVALAALAILVATSSDFGMAWDEGHTIRRERILAGWFARLASAPAAGSVSRAFSERELDRSWRFSREEPDGHPPFYALLGLAGWQATRGFLNPLDAYRFGPMALCAATAGVLFFHLATRCGRLAGFTVCGLFLLTPRTLAHAHYAHYDMPMTCLWLLAQVAFLRSLSSTRWAVAFGVALGLAAGTKFTGFFAAVPPTLWVACAEGPEALRRLTRRRNGGAELATALPGVRALAIALPIAALALFAVNPPWWLGAWRGIQRYVVSNTTRDQSLPVPTMYFGHVYSFSLPWHNTLVLTAITVPLAVSALGLVGTAAAWRQRKAEPWCLIWVLSWATLMVVRALPNAPGHDGIRLILPSIASLAVLAGLGAGWLSRLSGFRGAAWIAPLAVAAAFGESAVGIARTYPYTDSYYNLAIGGLKGAERHGFELTYYWETMGPEFFDWVERETRKRPLELMWPMPVITTVYQREWGMFGRAKVDPSDTVTAPDYMLQRRRGVYLPHDWWLERYGRPIFVIRREGTDLMRVYPLEQLRRAVQETANTPVPSYVDDHWRNRHLHYKPAGD